MGGPTEQVKERRFAKPVRVLLAIWFLLGSLPLFISMFGYDFLPSIELMTMISLPGVVAGLVSAVLFFWVVLKGVDRLQVGEVKKFLGILVSPIFGYFLGRNVVFVGPMLIALIAGHQIELPFTVLHADGSGSRGCRSPLKFQGLPFLIDRVCGVSKDFRQRLAPGRRIVVIGRGNSFGVYADKLRLMD